MIRKLFQHPLSLTSYAAIFIALTLLLFAILGWLTLSHLQNTRDKVTAVQLNSADAELSHALSHVEGVIRAQAQELADWDEVHQQLSNPTYYAYWREHRLMKSDLVHSYIRQAEVYSAQEKVLAKTTESGLPNSLPELDLEPYLVVNDEDISLFFFAPVLETRNGHARIGYIGLRADFQELFHSLNRFRFLDENTLRFTAATNSPIPLSRIKEHLHYQLRSNPEAEAVQEVMETAVLRLAVTIGALAVLFYIMLATLLGMPLRRLSQIIDHLKKSPDDQELISSIETLPIAELEKVRHSLNEYRHQLQTVHSNLDEKNKALWEMAHHDPLTGAFNRRAFDVDWNNLCGTLAGQRLDIAFILFDCNHFKAINDTYGHSVGDQVIRHLAQGIRDGLRHGDKLYRIGGDEFSTMLVNCSAECAQEVAERCIREVQNIDFNLIGIKEPVRVSVGVSYSSGEILDDLNALQWQADIAMYRAKRPGSGHLQFYTDGMEDGAINLVSSLISNAVYDAITQGKGIEIHYQPIIRLETGVVEYFEALARIRNEDGLLNPGSFLPLVESRQLELEFDLAVLSAIQQDLQQGVVPAGSGVSINLSGHSVAHAHIADSLRGFSRFRDQFKLLLEVTETALITQLEPATHNLNEARKSGFLIALDDFGSGYSSLRYLANMPVDIVKFDISMVRQMAEGGRKQVMLEQLASMIAEAGYWLVAEGIETAELRSLVEQAGFHYGQGYLFGKPARDLQRHRGKQTGNFTI